MIIINFRFNKILIILTFCMFLISGCDIYERERLEQENVELKQEKEELKQENEELKQEKEELEQEIEELKEELEDNSYY